MMCKTFIENNKTGHNKLLYNDYRLRGKLRNDLLHTNCIDFVEIENYIPKIKIK